MSTNTITLDSLQISVNNHLADNAPEYVEEELTGKTVEAGGFIFYIADSYVFGRNEANSYYAFDEDGNVVKSLASEQFEDEFGEADDLWDGLS